MGLDMYLYKTEKFSNLKYATIEDKKKNKNRDEYYSVKVLVNGNTRPVNLYELHEVTLKNGTVVNLWHTNKIVSTGVNKRIEGSTWVEKTEGEHVQPITILFSDIDTITYTYAYWRKANQIHNWFVNNIQNGEDDCGEYEVKGSDLIDLVELCKEVKDKHKDEYAKAILPPSEGFFFGSYEIDDYYYSELTETIDQLKDVKENEIYTYHSSW